MAFAAKTSDASGLIKQSVATMAGSDVNYTFDKNMGRFYVHCLTTNVAMYFQSASSGNNAFTLVAGGTPIEFRMPDLAGQTITFNAASGTVEIIEYLAHL